ncbi:MAG: nucleotidyltransferase family protein [Thermoleophilia bacterium]
MPDPATQTARRASPAPVSRELALLRHLVRGERDPLATDLADPALVQSLLLVARRHRLASYAYARLRELGLVPLLPPPLATAAKATALLEQRRVEQLAAELGRLDGLATAAGVPLLFLKGPLFAQRYYGSVDARGVADLDVLVRDPAALEPVLLAAGYRRAFRVPVTLRIGRAFAHHFEYERGDVHVDVHWALQRQAGFRLDHGRVWSTATEVELAGRRYAAASDEVELVLQLLGLVTDVQVGKLVLRTAVDVRQLLAAVGGGIDWDAFAAARERERILRPCVYALRATHDLLDERPADPALARLLDRPLRGLPPVELATRVALGGPLGPRERLRALGVYESGRPVSAAWWAVSLPARLAVYGLTRH